MNVDLKALIDATPWEVWVGLGVLVSLFLCGTATLYLFTVLSQGCASERTGSSCHVRSKVEAAVPIRMSEVTDEGLARRAHNKRQNAASESWPGLSRLTWYYKRISMVADAECLEELLDRRKAMNGEDANV
jgi:hypothetical protein